MHQLTRLTLDRPKAMLFVIGAITVFFAAGLPNLRTEFGYRVLVGDAHPSIVALDELIDRFGGGFPLSIAWECGNEFPCQTVFDPQSLEMANDITRAISRVQGVLKVDSPATTGLLVPAENGFSIRRLIENGQVAADAEWLARRALEDPFWVGNLVSTDGTVGMIIVQPSDTSSETDVRLVDAVGEAIRPYEEKGFEFNLVGDAVATVVAGRELAQSTANLIPFTVLVIGLVLLGLSHSIQYVAIALVTMGIASMWTFGMLAWLDWPKDGILEVLAPLILIVGVCDAVHLLSRYAVEIPRADHSASREQRRAAILAASNEVGPPCLITTLTTCGAFLSFVTSALDTFIRFGMIAAFGVAACLVLTFTLLPLIAVLLPTKSARAERAADSWRFGLNAIIDTSERRATPILFLATISLMVCGTGWLSFLRVDTSWIESFGEQSRVVQSIRFVEDRIRPNDTLEISISLPTNSPLEDPKTLTKIGEMSEFISEIDGMGVATSIVDFIARLNRVLNDDLPAFERPGSSFARNAELLELVGFDDPDFLRSWTSLDRSQVRVSVRSPEQSYSSRGNILKSVDQYIQTRLPKDWTVSVGGRVAIYHDWIRDVQSTQLRSFPTAFLIVFVMVAIFFRSIRLALAAMVPTVLPIVVTLGTMGLMGMSLDIGRAMIAAILLGIAVDDSVHVLRQYEVRRSLGDDPRQAIRAAILHTGRAVVTTSLALSLGFLTLMASAWQTISSFGFFVALAIMGALAAVLFVLPALIFTFARER